MYVIIYYNGVWTNPFPPKRPFSLDHQNRTVSLCRRWTISFSPITHEIIIAMGIIRIIIFFQFFRYITVLYEVTQNIILYFIIYKILFVFLMSDCTRSIMATIQGVTGRPDADELLAFAPINTFNFFYINIIYSHLRYTYSKLKFIF